MIHVKDKYDRETEAIPTVAGGIGEAYVVRGQLLPAWLFDRQYTREPERRVRGERRKRPRTGRRMRDHLTQREMLALSRGIEWVEISPKGMR